MKYYTRTNAKFPFHLFYSDGRIQCIKELYYHTNRHGIRKWIPNPNYLKFVKSRIHTTHGKAMVSLTVDNTGTQKTIQLSQVLAQTFFFPRRTKKKVWFLDNDYTNFSIDNLYWVNQGDLNLIQQELGTRDMVKQASIMRKRRPKDFGGGRKPGGKIIKRKYITRTNQLSPYN